MLCSCQGATKPRQDGAIQHPGDRVGDAGGAGGGTNSHDGAVAWPYWPASMLVHPMTRFVENTDNENERILELRLEFRDRDGVFCRAFGSLRVDLHDRAPDGRGNGALMTWEMDLRDLDVNRDRFDEVVRMYLFRLAVPKEDMPRQPQVQVYYLSADGAMVEVTEALGTGD